MRCFNVREQFEVLQVLLAVFCQESGVTLQLSEHDWSFNNETRVIKVSSSSLATHGSKACAGFLVHEIGHVLISVTHYLGYPGMSRGMAQHLANSIEDTRVDRWMGLRYPGAKHWIECGDDQILGRKRNMVRELPQFLCFCFGCSTLLDEKALEHLQFTPEVTNALSATRAIRMQISTELPPLECEMRSLDTESWRQLNDIIPYLNDKAGKLPLEEKGWALLSAHKSFAMVEQHVTPIARHLYEQDVYNIASYLTLDGNMRNEVVFAVADGNFAATRKLVPSIIRILPDMPAVSAVEASTIRCARKLFEMFLVQPALQQSVKLKLSVDYGCNVLNYNQMESKMRPQVKPLLDSLAQLFVIRQRSHFVPRCPSGNRLNLKMAMRYAQNRNFYNQLWDQRVVPPKTQVALLLLVDLSGSMRHEKIEAALESIVLFLETLECIEVKRAVMGFQDVLIPAVAFDDPLGARQKRAVEQFSQEVCGECCGGNNVPQYNDDGPCLLEACALLLQQRAQEYFAFVISDGHPEGRSSSASDLRDAVKSLTKIPNMKLIGLGLGADTEHVSEYYPQHLANISTDKLAGEIGSLVLSALS